MTSGSNTRRPPVAPARLVAFAMIAMVGANGPAAAASTAPVSHPTTGRTQDQPSQPPAAAQGGDPDPGQRSGVARARMLECGHQWSTMKRVGTASGTWKDFSRGCLAQR